MKIENKIPAKYLDDTSKRLAYLEGIEDGVAIITKMTLDVLRGKNEK